MGVRIISSNCTVSGAATAVITAAATSSAVSGVYGRGPPNFLSAS